MLREGWTITHFANTELKAPGIDLGATRGDREILFEVKGYPTTVYESGPKAGHPKPTPPSSQARQWYSHALLGVMRMREKHQSSEIAMCLPDYPTYRALVADTKSSLELLAIAVYLITEDGRVAVLLGPGGKSNNDA